MATAPDVTAGELESTGVEEQEEAAADLISRLPDGILGEIVSLLPTKDGARTQVISRRWLPLWRAAPLNVDVTGYIGGGCRWRWRVSADKISRILSEHGGPGRRFSAPLECSFDLEGGYAETLDGWLRSPALAGLRELEFHLGLPRWQKPPPPLPAPVLRLASTLRVASFGGCSFPEGNAGCGGELMLPVLEKLSLVDVRISEGALQALLAGCPVLESLLIGDNNGCSVIRIVSPSLRSIGVQPVPAEIKVQRLVIEDAPCLERLLILGSGFDVGMVVSVIRAPRLRVLGQLCAHAPQLEFGTTVFQGSQVVSATTVVHSVKVLALTQMDLSLDAVIDFLKCFPCLETLYIKTTAAGENNEWRRKYKNLIGTFDIRLKKLVLTSYRGNESHFNFAKFFALNARVLQLMRLEVRHANNHNSKWIKRQHRLLQTKDKASKDAQFDFVPHVIGGVPFSSIGLVCSEQVHDLATADPFAGFHDWF